MGKLELIEAFALVYKEDNYPPVAGKVLGLFFISNEKHLTFESIMDGINASKSATSKALNFLINLEEVSFIYSEKNKRKRLFHINPDGIKNRLENIIEAHKIETVLLKEALQNRNSGDNDMNILIQNIIAFNEDVLHFISGKVDEHFKK